MTDGERHQRPHIIMDGMVYYFVRDPEYQDGVNTIAARPFYDKYSGHYALVDINGVIYVAVNEETEQGGWRDP